MSFLTNVNKKKLNSLRVQQYMSQKILVESFKLHACINLHVHGPSEKRKKKSFFIPKEKKNNNTSKFPQTLYAYFICKMSQIKYSNIGTAL